MPNVLSIALLAFLPIFVVVSLRNARTGFLLWLVVSPFTVAPIVSLPFLVPDISFDMVAIIALYGGMFLRNEYPHLRGVPTRPLDRWMFIFCAVLGLSLLLFYRPKDASRYLLTITHHFVFPFLFYRLCRYLLIKDRVFDEGLVAEILDRMIFVAAILSLMGIYEGITWIDLLPMKATTFSLAHGGGLRIATGWPRVNGPYSNPETYGTVVALLLFVVLLRTDLLRKEPSGRRSRNRLKVLAILLLLLIPAVAFNLFRSVWLAIVAGLFVRFLVLPERRLRLATIVALCLLVLVVVWPLVTSTRVYSERLSYAGSYLSRIGANRYAFEVVTRNPLIGIGFDRMPKYIEHAIESGRILTYQGVEPAFTIHNAFINLLAENGIIGLLPFVAILSSVLVLCVRHLQAFREQEGKYYGAAFIVFLVVYFVPMLFDRLIYDGKLNNVVFTLFAILVSRLDAFGLGWATRPTGIPVRQAESSSDVVAVVFLHPR